MKIHPLFYILLFFAAIGLNAQKKYTLSTGQESIIVGLGTAGSAGGYLLLKETASLALDSMTYLKREQVNLFDRSATFNYSKKIAEISDLTLLASCIVPFSLLMGKEVRNESLAFGVILSETVLLTTTAVTITKATVLRNRPFVYNPDVPNEKKTVPDARHSFFSGHTALSFALATFFSVTYQKYYPHSDARPYLSTAVYGLSTATAYFRYKAGRHYPTDILTGAIVGTLIGYAVPKLHETSADKVKAPVNYSPASNIISIRLIL